MNKSLGLVGATGLAVLLGTAQLEAGRGGGGHGGGYGGHGGHGFHGGYGGYGYGYAGHGYQLGGYGYSYPPAIYTPPAYECPTNQPACTPPAASYSAPTYGGGYQKPYSPPPRQYYTGWQYDATRSCYSCYYHYLPATNSTAYHSHEVIYFAGDTQHYYYFNPYKRKFWGRAPVHQMAGAPRYSRLTPETMREQLQEIPASSFPAPGAMPAIPESVDSVAMTLPQGGASLTPDKVASAQGDWRVLLQDAAGKVKQLDMSIKPDGTASMTQIAPGELPSSMQCRYHFDDTTLKMAGDYGQFNFQVADVSKDRLSLQLNGANLVFQRP